MTAGPTRVSASLFAEELAKPRSGVKANAVAGVSSGCFARDEPRAGLGVI
jgi:hypothetical protein